MAQPARTGESLETPRRAIFAAGCGEIGGAAHYPACGSETEATAMIIDLPRFIDAERPSWTELERLLDRMEKESHRALSLEDAKRLHLLYQRVATDLGRIATFASEPQLRSYLESLTARA